MKLYMCGQQGAQVSKVLVLEHHHVLFELKVCDNWRLEYLKWICTVFILFQMTTCLFPNGKEHRRSVYEHSSSRQNLPTAMVIILQFLWSTILILWGNINFTIDESLPYLVYSETHLEMQHWTQISVWLNGKNFFIKHLFSEWNCNIFTFYLSG